MYSINRTDNTISPLQRRSFKDLNFTERAHLQEWLAKHPQALGDLLIIQKEFDGFDGTRERLDLLALDKRGHLVVIENKLDDSGRDVIWQSLKYAAYCSTLKPSQIVDIYSRYLGQTADTARETIAEFMQIDDSDELALNTANSQRIILVAASFRPEITATAMWLLGKGVNITCVLATPFTQGDDIFLTIDQIIPPPEASDYMIQLAEKSAVEETANAKQSERHVRRRAYWEALKTQWDASGTTILSGKSHSSDNWMTVASGTSGIHYSITILQTEVKVQLTLDDPDAARIARMFAYLQERASLIEEDYGAPLLWHNPPNAKRCSLIHAYQINTNDRENWPAAIEWQRVRLEALMKTLTPYIPEIAKL